jgi:hypothetical protein
VRTLVAGATGSGRISIRVLTGVVLAVFLAAYATVGLLLLPVVGAALGIAALPGQARSIARRLAGWALGARVAIRSVLVGLLSLGR